MVDISFFASAPCKGVTHRLFPVGEAGPGRKGRDALEREAIAEICSFCTVRAECLEYAISTGQSSGAMGGKTSAELKVLIAERGNTFYSNRLDRQY